MMRRRRLITRISLVAVIAVFFVVTSVSYLSRYAYAEGSIDNITNVALLKAMQSCYTQMSGSTAGIQQRFDPSAQSFSVVNKYGGGYTQTLITPSVIKDGSIKFYMPTNLGNTLNNRGLTCYEVFNGTNGLTGGGLFSRYNKNTSSVSLDDMGYIPAANSSAAKYSCAWIGYKVYYGDNLSLYVEKSTNRVCYPVDENGKITQAGTDYVQSREATGSYAVGANAADGVPKGGVVLIPSGNSLKYSIYDEDGDLVSVTSGMAGPTTVFPLVSDVVGKTTYELANDINNAAGLIETRSETGPFWDRKATIDMMQSYYGDDSAELATEYVIQGSSSFKIALKWLTGTDDINSFGVTDDEWADLYNQYITKLRNDGKISINMDCNASKSDSNVITFDNGATWCEVDVSKVGDELFASKSNTPQFGLLQLRNITDLLSSFKNLDYDKVDSDTVTNPSSPSDGDDNTGSVSSITACYESAGVLGWIACPVLEVLSWVTSGLYGFIEGSLAIGSDVMGSDGIRSGWSIFQGFANTIFVIVFVLVILSQLTGIGISNYGVKKILPRLIMVVVLVNISFIVCQLAVDLSNILGSSFKSTFDGFAETVASSVRDESGNPGVPFNLATVALGLAGTSVAVGGIVKVTAVLAVAIPFELWLFPIILAFIGCVISIFFFFILLGVRQAGIVVLITLAPVAIVCYALPNTKTFFDRWRKMFVALLLVYPICGLLMGGGSFASTLLLSVAHDGNTGGFFVVVAMLMSVVPFFMIPSIVKGSMSAMGNLGVKIAGFGSNFGSRVTNGIRNSELGRDIQREANKKYLDRAAIKIERQQGKLSGNILKGRKSNRLKRYNNAYNRYSFEDIRAGGASHRIKPGSDEYKSLEQGQMTEQLNKEFAGLQTLYKGGMVESKAHAGTMVNGDDEGAMIDELDYHLGKIIDGVDHGRSADNLSENVKHAQTIINTLSDTGRGSTLAKVENSFLKAYDSRRGILTTTDANKKVELGKTFGAISSRTKDKYGATYKKFSPSAAAMFSDFAKGEYSRVGTVRSVTELNNDGSVAVDSSGNPITHLMSSGYSRTGLSGINSEDLTKMKTGYLSNVLSGIQNGDISSSDMLDIVQAADNVLANPNQFPADADVLSYIERIRNAVLTSSQAAQGGRTVGSVALGKVSDDAIVDMVNSLNGVKWTVNSPERAAYVQLAKNIHDSLDNDMYTHDSIKHLKKALQNAHADPTARGLGVQQAGPGAGKKVKIPHKRK